MFVCIGVCVYVCVYIKTIREHVCSIRLQIGHKYTHITYFCLMYKSLFRIRACSPGENVLIRREELTIIIIQNGSKLYFTMVDSLSAIY